MIKYINGKKVEYEEILPEEPIVPKEEQMPTESERIEALEMAMLDLLGVIAND